MQYLKKDKHTEIVNDNSNSNNNTVDWVYSVCSKIIINSQVARGTRTETLTLILGEEWRGICFINVLMDTITGSNPVLTTTIHISVFFYIVLVLRYGVLSLCVVRCLKFYSNTTHKNTV